MINEASEALMLMQRALDLLDAAGEGHKPYACKLQHAIDLMKMPPDRAYRLKQYGCTPASVQE